MFTEKELAYLKSQPLGRLATVSPDGQPDNSPVGFEFEEEVFYVGSHYDMAKTRKYKNVHDGNAQVALVVDDLESTDPWVPRGIRVFGIADLVEREGRFGSGVFMRITPQVSWSWNVEGSSIIDGKFVPNKIIHE